jgi:hypothetical protein
MDYQCLPLHDFLNECVAQLSKTRPPRTGGTIWGPLGNSVALWELVIDTDSNNKITHMGLTISTSGGLKPDTIFSVIGKCSNGKVDVFKIIGNSFRNCNVPIPSIETAMKDVLMKDA